MTDESGPFDYHEVEIPEHLLERSRARRAELAERDEITSQEIVPLSFAQRLADNLVVESGVPECSIAASDIAEDADRIFQSALINLSDAKEISSSPLKYVVKVEKTLLMADQEFTEQPAEVYLLSSVASTKAGYRVELALAELKSPQSSSRLRRKKEPEGPTKLTLLAITRDNLAFPLVRFTRSSQEYCDHLQFWGEEKMDELQSQNFYGWGSDDNGSRFEAVVAVGEVLQRNNAKNALELVSSLQLDKRLSAELGTFNPEIETIIDQVFSGQREGARQEFKREYANVQMGKVTTDLTVEGVLETVQGYPARKLLTVREYPSSQPDRQWPEQMFIIDQRNGIVALTKEDEKCLPSELDLATIRELLNTSAQHSSLQKLEPEDQNEREWFLFTPKGLLAYFIGTVAAGVPFGEVFDAADTGDVFRSAAVGTYILATAGVLVRRYQRVERSALDKGQRRLTITSQANYPDGMDTN